MATEGIRHLRTSDLKSKILHNARSNIFMVNIPLPGGVGGPLGRFLQQSGRDLFYSGLLQDNLQLRCFETVLPGSALATHEVEHDHIGVSDRMAYRRLYDSDIDLQFYVDYNYNIIELFDGWIDYISGLGVTASRDTYRNVAANFRFRFPDTYKTSIFITKFEKGTPTDDLTDRTLLEYELINAFPILTNSIPVSYASDDLLRYSVRFGYMRYVRRRKTYQQAFDNPQLSIDRTGLQGPPPF